MRIVYIILFGVLGVLSRYYAGLVIPKLLPPPFPFGTFLINISGAFLIGVIQVLGTQKANFSADLRIGIMVGFLGGYTTFSSYCLESFRLLEEMELLKAAVYFLGSPILGFLAAMGGVFLTRFALGASL